MKNIYNNFYSSLPYLKTHKTHNKKLTKRKKEKENLCLHYYNKRKKEFNTAPINAPPIFTQIPHNHDSAQNIIPNMGNQNTKQKKIFYQNVQSDGSLSPIPPFGNVYYNNMVYCLYTLWYIYTVDFIPYMVYTVRKRK